MTLLRSVFSDFKDETSSTDFLIFLVHSGRYIFSPFFPALLKLSCKYFFILCVPSYGRLALFFPQPFPLVLLYRLLVFTARTTILLCHPRPFPFVLRKLPTLIAQLAYFFPELSLHC